MRKFLAPLFMVFVVTAVPAISVAQDDEGLTPDQVQLGEVRINLTNVDYPSIRVDGEPWDESEFTANGKQVSLHRVNRTVQHIITLIPNYPGFAEIELVVVPGDWKLVKLNRLDRAWRVEEKVKFKKEKVPPPKAEPVKKQPATE